MENVILFSDQNYPKLEKAIKKAEQEYPAFLKMGHDRNQVYLSEKALLSMVRTGNINYHDALTHSIGLSTGVPLKNRDPLRQAKTNVVVFTTLVTRAAIEGGLSPEIAYALGDYYIQTAEDSRGMDGLTTLASAMYHDFIFRVHHVKVNSDLSLAVQKCCDYIELSLDKKILITDLAQLCGYSPYYLSQKFREETGHTINEHIRRRRVERSKLMLTTTDRPIHEIAERLGFNTPNYFIQCFRETVGITPAEFRRKRGKIAEKA